MVCGGQRVTGRWVRVQVSVYVDGQRVEVGEVRVPRVDKVRFAGVCTSVELPNGGSGLMRLPPIRGQLATAHFFDTPLPVVKVCRAYRGHICLHISLPMLCPPCIFGTTPVLPWVLFESPKPVCRQGCGARDRVNWAGRAHVGLWDPCQVIIRASVPSCAGS